MLGNGRDGARLDPEPTWRIASGAMDLGMNLPVMVPGLDRAHLLAWARRIDAGPFSTLAAGERVNLPNPDMMVALGAAALVTERVRIMPNVVVLPMHSAVHVAKQLATLDVLSSGRVVAGVGVGARAEDFAAHDVPFRPTRLRRLEEQVGVMRRVWAGEIVVEGAGRPVEPFPVQPGGPPVLTGSLTVGSIRRAARFADGIAGFAFGPDPAELDLAFGAARQAWREQGREKPPRLVTGCWFALGSRAREQLDEYLGRYLAFMGPGAAKGVAPLVRATSPEALREVTRQVADAGADELCLVPTTLDVTELDRVADALG
jgi:alkanesulfonate monooxygenase SsuD/methylene tetrahydromethanopterin reductase-like flavin-dependent oxidoreductase (luciferase family)